MLQFQKIVFQKELIKIKLVYRKNVNFAAIDYWFFQDIAFKFEEHVCNKCHDFFSTVAYSLRDIAILNAKGNTFRCVLMGISKNERFIRLDNSVTYDRGVL